MAVEDREAVDDAVLVRGARAGQAAASRAADGFPGQFVAPNWALVCLSAPTEFAEIGNFEGGSRRCERAMGN